MGTLTFLTSHARALICLANSPGIKIRGLADQIGITERAAHRVLAELERAGCITRHRLGQRNFYELHPSTPLSDPLLPGWTVGDLLAAFTRRSPPGQAGGVRPLTS